MEKLEGTIIGVSPLRETSAIVRWSTAGAGIVHTVANGVRRPGSDFHGRIDLFYRGEFLMARSRRSTLHNLRELVLLDPRTGLRSEYVRTLAAAYFVRLVEATAEVEAPVPEEHALLDRALDYLAGRRPVWGDVLHFERRLAAVLGLEGHRDPRAALVGLCGRLPSQRTDLRELLRPEGEDAD